MAIKKPTNWSSVADEINLNFQKKFPTIQTSYSPSKRSAHHYSLSKPLLCKLRKHRDLEGKEYSDTALSEKHCKIPPWITVLENCLNHIRKWRSDKKKTVVKNQQINNLIDIKDDDMINKRSRRVLAEVFGYFCKTTSLYLSLQVNHRWRIL